MSKTPDTAPAATIGTKPKRTPRTDAATHAKRIDEVYYLLLRGMSRKQIIEHSNKSEWNVSGRTISSYIAAAFKEITEINKESKERRRALYMRRLEDLYAKSFRICDYKTCAGIIDRAVRLDGLDRETIGHIVTITDYGKLTEQINAAIAADPEARARIVSTLPDYEEE